MLTLPLWIVTEHIQPTESDIAPQPENGFALAFSEAKGLFNFMKEHAGGEWKMQMADDRDGLVILIADLHRLEISKLNFDPDAQGNGGESFSLSDMMDLADSMRK
jgi:hypothetical protein